MKCRYLPLLLVTVLSVALGEEVPCTTTKDKCTQSSAFSALSIRKDKYYCCDVGYTMKWNEAKCLCNKTSEVLACDVGQACNNDNVTLAPNIDNSNVTRCCQADYNIAFFAGRFDNHNIVNCMCSRSLNGGHHFIQHSNEHISFMNHHTPPKVNTPIILDEIDSVVTPCMTTRANCTNKKGFSSVSMTNNNYYCCAAGYSMTQNNNSCSCAKTSEVEPCDVSCSSATKDSSKGSHVPCCEAGFTMHSSPGSVIGNCTCTRHLHKMERWWQRLSHNSISPFLAFMVSTRKHRIFSRICPPEQSQ